MRSPLTRKINIITIYINSNNSERSIMTTATFSVRMDPDIKRQLDEFCSEVGMNTSTAINLFAHSVVRERRLPFNITTNNLSEEELLSRMADLKAGRNVVTKTLEELEAMEHE